MTAARAIKFVTLIFRLLQLLLAAYIVGVAGYHTWEFATNRLSLTDASSGQPPKALYTIFVISCVTVLYTSLSLFTTCFGHKKFFLATLIMDFLLLGGSIAISILMRGSPNMSCDPLEYSDSITSSSNDFPSNIYRSSGGSGNLAGTLCQLDKSVFAFAVALSVLFLITLLLSYLALRNHRKNRAFGPGPENGYSTRNNQAPRSWKRNPFNRTSEETAHTHNTNMSGVAAGMASHDDHGYEHRPSELGRGYRNSRQTPTLNPPEEPGPNVSPDYGRVAPHQMF
ncbi:unnamed protein product [Tuber melanosporum]|jgi:hypothetical protein|uniref:(Perigord truffle) hypothetical protein n=1 Tax=Tuber melanosporum (strain Mel28) TaxID=656061 RepID=D5GNI6_TUBMM|nr:uncharacterized protein GSTUM_00011305001 [Tuber melanosporum]CAZ86079.1 unnamed protein product [Tuber melanosporum]